VTSVRIASWSNVLPTHTNLIDYHDGIVSATGGAFIPRGAGRSFGDAAYLGGGTTIRAAADRAAADAATCRFEPALDRVTCDASLSIGDIQRAVEQAGRYLAVFGGTQWATAGGAVASDIHTKDDMPHGSCGNHVDALTVVTPDGAARRCSREQEPDLFAATIGGMGLTGYIRDVTFRLLPARPMGVRIRAASFGSIAEMEDLLQSTGTELQVCEWVDLTRPEPRGILWYAAYHDDPVVEPRRASEMWLPRIGVFNRATVRLLEQGTLAAARRLDLRVHRRRFHYGSAHEAVRNWNRLFGRRGFIEYHFAVPAASFPDAFTLLLDTRRTFGASAYFAAGKRLGAIPRAGMLSFPLDGYGMNFQVPDSARGRRFLAAFTDELGGLGGRVYLAKDSVVDARQFSRMYERLPEWQRVVRRYDPGARVQSDLSRRLELKRW
jgi:decaprenylphospho-beta-D-ribofuranose 2-oxidase